MQGMDAAQGWGPPGMEEAGGGSCVSVFTCRTKLSTGIDKAKILLQKKD